MAIPPVHALMTKKDSCPAVFQRIRRRSHRQLRVEQTAKQDSTFISIAKLGLSLNEKEETNKNNYSEISSIQKSQKLKELTVTEAPNITYLQLLNYQRIAKDYFDKQVKEPKTKYRRRSEELDHALTLDPFNRCFFIHLESPVKGVAPYDRNYDIKFSKALMVSKESITTAVVAIACDERAYSDKEFQIKNKFSHSPYIEPAPLCVVRYREADTIIPSMRINKVSSLCIPLISDFSCYGREVETSRLEIFIPLLLDIARGLNDLHRENFIHGDIRPENLVIASDPKKKGVIAMISGFDSMREIDKKGKKKYRRSLEKGKRPRSNSKSAAETLYRHNKEPSLYSSPEYLLLGQEAELSFGDIWSFGVTAWQCLYGKNTKEALFPNSTEHLTEIDVYKTLNAKLPKPQTEQEDALQKIIRECLRVDISERIESVGLVDRLEEASKITPAPYKPPFEERGSLEELFKPLNGSASKQKKQRRYSFHQKRPARGTQSLPHELFIFCTEEVDLGDLINKAKKLIKETLLNNEATIEKINSAKESLQETSQYFNDLESRVNHYKPSQGIFFRNHKEEIDAFKKELLELEKIIDTARLKNGGGLTFNEFNEIKKFAGKQLKILKKEKPRFLSNGPKAPLFLHHFPKKPLEGLKYPLSIDSVSEKIFVHLKKRGARTSALGKGADKSAHIAVQIAGETLEGIADVVIRKATFNSKEQRLKEFFADSPFIESSAPYFTVYEKEEVPGLWKEKAYLSQEKINECMEGNKKENVVKVAFLGPLYDSSLSGLSYELKDGPRNIPLIINLLHDVIEGLAFMHGKGYIHRDLKPSNIFVKKEIVSGKDIYTGIIADLGETVNVEENKFLMVGTEHYYSPEICRDKKDERYQRQSFASDIWAFGLLACQALYGESGRDIPFLDNESNTHLCAQINSLTQEGVDEALESRFPKEGSDQEKNDQRKSIQGKNIQNIIMQCLRVDPASRPTADQLAELFSKNFK